MKRPLCWVSVCTIAGAVYYQLLPTILSFIPIVLLFLICLIFRPLSISIKRFMLIGASFVFGAVLSCYYLHVANHIQQQAYGNGRFEGKVVETTDYGFVMRLSNENAWFTFDALVNTGDYTVSVGEQVIVYGTANAHRPPRNDGSFDAKTHYHSTGNLYCVEADHVVTIQSASKLRRLFQSIHKSVETRIQTLFSEQSEGFLVAILLGSHDSLNDSLYEQYQNFGIAHVLAISGMHIAILGRLLVSLCSLGFKKAHSHVIVSFLLFLYGMLTDFSVSSIRAIVAFAIVAFAYLSKRTSDPLTTIVFLALLFVMKRPTIVGNVAFQMSFASGGLILMLQNRNPDSRSADARWKSTLRSSMLMQFGLLPLQVYYFYTFSLYGVLVNVVVLISIEIIFVLFLLCIACSYIIWPLSVFLSGGVEWSVRGLNALCMALRELPGATVTLGRPRGWQLFLYVCIFAFLFYKIKSGQGNRILLLLVAWMVMLPIPSSTPVLYNLDVGQGDCSVLLCNNQCVVIDCGSTGREHVGRNCLKPFLEYHGIDTIHAMFFSHVDKDHTNGGMELLEDGVYCEKVFLPVAAKESDLESRLSAMGCPYEFVSQGDRGTLAMNGLLDTNENEIAFEVLWPTVEYTDDSNRESTVLLLNIGGNKALFTGDISEDVMIELSEEYSDEISGLEYLKVPHHGSRSSLCEAFYEVTQPVLSVICVGPNVYGHPTMDVLACLIKHSSYYLTTMDSGQISIAFDEDGIVISEAFGSVDNNS